MWAVRESGLGATGHVPGKPLMWEGWEDAAVAPEKLGRYLRELRTLLERYGYSGDFYGHFGDGCVHTRTNFDLTSKPGIAKFRALHRMKRRISWCARRFVLRRAWRRSGPRRAAGEDVRPGADAGVPASSRRSGIRTGR